MEVNLRDERRTHVGWRDLPSSAPEDADPSQSVRLFSEIKSAAKAAGAKMAGGEEVRTERDELGRDGPFRADYYDAGQDIVRIGEWAIAFGSSGALILFLRTSGTALVQWLKNRGSRSVTVKYGDIEVALRGSNDLEKALEAVEQLNDRSASD